MLTVNQGVIDAERSVRQDHIVVLTKHGKISFQYILLTRAMQITCSGKHDLFLLSCVCYKSIKRTSILYTTWHTTISMLAFENEFQSSIMPYSRLGILLNLFSSLNPRSFQLYLTE